ncbi:MAG: hypothetical protein IAE97_01380 [Chthoniobacterales bacterium]|nr:hypothetical protein [Chthoniobacterales bacterium]
MNRMLETGLLLAAAGQACLAVLNLNVARIMRWQSDIERMPLLVRQVFHVHTWFVSAALLIFAVLTWRFAPQIAAGGDPVYRWLACAIGIFWGVRAMLQVCYYSSSHWRGIPSRTVVHVILLAVYSSWAVLYLSVGMLPGIGSDTKNPMEAVHAR